MNWVEITNMLIIAAFGWCCGWILGQLYKRQVKKILEPLQETADDLRLEVYWLEWILSGRRGEEIAYIEELLERERKNADCNETGGRGGSGADCSGGTSAEVLFK